MNYCEGSGLEPSPYFAITFDDYDKLGAFFETNHKRHEELSMYKYHDLHRCVACHRLVKLTKAGKIVNHVPLRQTFMTKGNKLFLCKGSFKPRDLQFHIKKREDLMTLHALITEKGKCHHCHKEVSYSFKDIVVKPHLVPRKMRGNICALCDNVTQSPSEYLCENCQNVDAIPLKGIQ